MRRKATTPYRGSMLRAMKDAGMTDPSWDAWRSFWRAVFGMPLPPGIHLETYRKHTNRSEPPKAPVSEAWAVCGRGAGKSRNAALAGLYMAVRFDVTRLAPGEPVVIPILAANTRQAHIVFRYLRALFEMPAFRPFVHQVLKRSIELHSGLTVEVLASKFQTLRGYTLPCVIADEIAFWVFDSEAANPDTEVLAALRPGLDRVDDGLLIGISSPYARKGALFEMYDRYFGQDDPEVLIWNSDTLSMNPTFKQSRIERRFAEDPSKASAEYGSGGFVQFRRDIELFLDAETIQAVTVAERRELPPVKGTTYCAFTDPSGGSRDSFTLAIGHREGSDRAVLDCLRERRPPFSPDNVVKEFAELLQSYGLYSVTGDRFGGEWVSERFRVQGIAYKTSERAKSDLYRELIAPINSGRIELLDLPVLRAQLIGLERRTSRAGRDSIDHPPGGRDDVANAVAGALVNVLPTVSRKKKLMWA